MKPLTFELLGAEKFRRKLSTAEREVFPTAHARALNRSIMMIRTRTVRAVARQMGIKQKDVRDRVRITKASPAKQNATAEFRGAAFNIVRFKARQTKRGVSAAPWGQRRMYRGAFVATINGVRVVMIRRRRGTRRAPRLPIRPVLGPGIAKTAAEEQVAAQREDVMRTVYPAELRRNLGVLVDRLMRR